MARLNERVTQVESGLLARLDKLDGALLASPSAIADKVAVATSIELARHAAVHSLTPSLNTAVAATTHSSPAASPALASAPIAAAASTSRPSSAPSFARSPPSPSLAPRETPAPSTNAAAADDDRTVAAFAQWRPSLQAPTPLEPSRPLASAAPATTMSASMPLRPTA